jgi:hypothetical protein
MNIQKAAKKPERAKERKRKHRFYEPHVCEDEKKEERLKHLSLG